MTEAETTSLAHLTNDELRQELNNNGIPYGPIMSSTRKVYEKKLLNFLADDHTHIVNGNAENGAHEALMNGNSPNNNKTKTPSRENTPRINEQPSNNDGSRQVSPSPKLTADNDSDNEEEASESTRLLTPDELDKFRSGFRRYADSPNSKANNINVRMRREASLPLQKKVINAVSIDGNKSRGATIAKRMGVPFLFVFLFGCLIAAIYYMHLHDQSFFPMLLNFSFGGNKSKQ